MITTVFLYDVECKLGFVLGVLLEATMFEHEKVPTNPPLTAFQTTIHVCLYT